MRRIKGKEAKNLYRFTAGVFFVQLLNGCGMCIFGALTSSLPLAEYLNAVTGWDLSADEYLVTGERILNIRKAFNVREGLMVQDQMLNERAAGKPPLQKGPLKAHCVLFIGRAAPGTRRFLNKKREADASLGNFDYKGF